MKQLIIFIFLFLLFQKLSFSQVNLTQGLVMYLPFNGNTLDASGNGNNTINFGATLTTDQAGNPNSAYSFNGASDYMQIASSAALQPTSFSICVHVKPLSFNNGLCFNNVIIGKGNSAGYGNGDFALTYTPTLNQNPSNYCIIPDSTHENYRVYAGANGAVNSLACINATNGVPYITSNNWDCVVGIYNDTTQTASVYVNGIFRYSYTIPSNIGINASDIFIGKQTAVGYEYWMNAVLDEVRIYNRAINVQEVQALCNSCNNPIITASANPPIVCSGNQTTITASGANTYNWTGGIQNGVAFMPTSTTTYTVIGTDANGCSATQTVTVTVNPLPTITGLGNTTICTNESVTLTATGNATSYTWSGGIQNGIAFTPLATTTYIVTATDINNCVSTKSVVVEVLTPPIVTASKENNIDCNHSTSQLQGMGATQYQWYPSNSLSNSNIANPIATPLTTTNYMLVGNNGNCVDTAFVEVEVNNLVATNIVVPNAFSPNNDGLNDYLNPIKNNASSLINFYFTIYNRWGQKVFETSNIDIGWEGHFNGYDAPNGTYYYFLHAETTCGNIDKKGDITLIK